MNIRNLVNDKEVKVVEEEKKHEEIKAGQEKIDEKKAGEDKSPKDLSMYADKTIEVVSGRIVSSEAIVHELEVKDKDGKSAKLEIY